MKKFLIPLFTFTFALHLCGATNLVSNTAIITNRVQGIVTYTMSNGVARVQDPSGKLIGTAEERALKVAAEGQADIASAAADAAGTAMEEWREFTATTDVKVVYIDAGFTQDLPALAPNLCGWVAGSFYDHEKGEDHYYVWFNREIDYPPSTCARIVSESGTNWLDGAWKDWAVTNWIDKATGREWARPYDAEVEYLESTGSQAIDLGISPDVRNITVDIDFQGVVSKSSSVWGYSGKRPWISLGNGYVSTSEGTTSIPYNQRCKFEIEILEGESNCVRFYLSKEFLNYSAIYNFDEHYDMSIFATRDYRGFNYYTNCRIFLFSISGTVNLDMIPVRFTNENGETEGAMYDRVSGKFFRKTGTGAFVIGNDTGMIHPPYFAVPCRELVVPRRNANCVLKTGTVITLGGKDGFDADIHKVNIEVVGTPTATTSAQLPLFYAVTRSGTNRVVRAYTNGFVNVENGFVKEPSNE